MTRRIAPARQETAPIARARFSEHKWRLYDPERSADAICDHCGVFWMDGCAAPTMACAGGMRDPNRDPSARAEPMADWLSQSELEDIERRALTDGVWIGAGIGLCIGTPIAFGVFWWLA
jgi:hypothetical protein